MVNETVRVRGLVLGGGFWGHVRVRVRIRIWVSEVRGRLDFVLGGTVELRGLGLVFRVRDRWDG